MNLALHWLPQRGSMTFRPLAFIGVLAALSGCLTSHAADLLWTPLHEPSAGGWITSLAVSPHDHNRILIGGDILGIGLSEDRGESWQETFGLKNWEIADFTWHPTDPNTVWAGTMGGLYLSRDGGRYWASVRTGFPPPDPGKYSTPIQKMLFDPNDANHLLTFGGKHREFDSPGTPDYGAVWASTNGGLGWKRLGAIQAGGNVMAAAFAAGSSTKLYAAVNDAGVYFSGDGGTNWALRTTGLPHLHTKDLVAHPVLADTVYVALWNAPLPGGGYTAGGIWWSTNAGVSWLPRNSGIRQNTGTTDSFVTRMKALAISPTNPRRLMAGSNDDPYHDEQYATGIWTSEDDGLTWRQQNSGLAQLRVECVTVDPHDPDLWVLGTEGRGFFVARWAGLSIRSESSQPTWRLVGPIGEPVRLDVTADFAGWSPIMTTSMPPHGVLISPSLFADPAFFRGVLRP